MIQVKSREDFNLPSVLTKLKPNNLNKAHSPLSLSQFRAGFHKLKPNIFIIHAAKIHLTLFATTVLIFREAKDFYLSLITPFVHF